MYTHTQRGRAERIAHKPDARASSKLEVYAQRILIHNLSVDIDEDRFTHHDVPYNALRYTYRGRD